MQEGLTQISGVALACGHATFSPVMLDKAATEAIGYCACCERWVGLAGKLKRTPDPVSPLTDYLAQLGDA